VSPGAGPSHAFVVPAYGESPWLADCLRSLRAQTVGSRIVVASSTPHERLGEVVEACGAQLALHAPNRGIGNDWNYALEQADADWVTLAHQDDLYLPTFTERTLAACRGDTRLVFTGYRECDATGRTRRASPMLGVKRALLELGFLGRATMASAPGKLRALRFGCPIACPAVTLNRRRLHRFRFREDLRVNLDWEAWVRLARLPGTFGYVRAPLMLHRIHAVSETSAAIRDGVRAAEDLEMFESLWPRPVARLLGRAYTLSYEAGSR
jgi:glycosyltransferase involved in cell wall biosynthesis